MDVAPAIVVISPVALKTAQKLSTVLDESLIHGFARRGSKPNVDYHLSFSEPMDHLRSLFQSGTPIIGICAAGILIRALAPVLAEKRNEPPVIAVSEDGSSVVPLLGGHRGANALAHEIAEILKGHAAITTAGDNVFGVALDDPPEGWTLANPTDAKSVMAHMLAGDTVKLSGQAGWLEAATLPVAEDADLEIVATEEPQDGHHGKLVFHPQTHVVGLGCSRGCSLEELDDLLQKGLEQANISIGAVAAFASIDLKADEVAMNKLAARYNKPFRLFTAEELNEHKERLQNPSDVVFAEVGCYGVSEGSALAGVGSIGTLVLEKQKTANATVAIAKASAPINHEKIGRARGRLHVIGIGPGQEAWRTPEASSWLAEADEVVGYGLYLDLVSSLIRGKQRHAFPLGAEEERVRFALERAGQGHNVALVCSGDSGVYAMGALVFELLDRPQENGGVSDAARRVEVASAPGISAMIALSNRIGAPLGHDFCAISLSDLLTPWETIQQRLEGAAIGDFVIGFYNPVSKRRRTQLAWAREKLLEHRPENTPVILGSNIGREDEAISTTTLKDLKVDDVDMLTTVIVGCSQTRLGGDGQSLHFVYTPRGYAKKIDAPTKETETVA
ncbi:cobalt-precorrin 5A hydrolase / precorrin-3B C17-methyltransferase [Pseudovibrio denitrificans]|uniref:Cobalt-precorrin 5A hydrolase / precorrin-3B C17-methyltransferase n=1 Tax=Pseudovibrio denitrificans TaxID=258256 RepID=A0A1I7B9S9_9HYPH|nr:precorrin-3B C(17)-methyltransferase [Pseudovibrio denitrificans]SFT83950.1 cobalt-precorrin 5A hydrolase / precorrin-3B C17-methyltransferase [Pseudovibrio denitrificans]